MQQLATALLQLCVRDPDEPGIDSVASFPVPLDACWRCNTWVDPDDEVGLCGPCKAKLREV